MPLKQMFDSSLDEMNSRASAFVGACGYETRSSAIAGLLAPRVTMRRAIAFRERADALSRKENDEIFRKNGFELETCEGGDANAVSSVLDSALSSIAEKQGAIAFDISSMTRDWHGAIVRTLIRESYSRSFEAFFLYVPGQFQPPSPDVSYNEIVRPIDGFASLASPNLPTALVIGLGYDPERALGLGNY